MKPERTKPHPHEVATTKICPFTRMISGAGADQPCLGDACMLWQYLREGANQTEGYCRQGSPPPALK